MSPTSVDLHPTARLVEQSSGLKTQLQHILQTAVTVAESDFGNIQLLDDAGHLKIVTHLGFESWWIDFWQTAAGDGHGACGAALANGGRVIVEDVLTSPVFANPADRETMVKAGIRAVQSTPVRARSGQLLGMFSTHYRAAHGLDAKTLKVLDLLAEHAAQAIERAQAEQALSMIGAEYQAIFRNAPVGIAQMDPVRRTFLKVNPAVCAMLGYTEDELVGRRLEDITYPADLEANLRDIQDLVAGKTSAFHIIKRYVHKDGSIVSGEVHVVNLPGVDGGPGTNMAVISDITERMRLEEERQRAHELLEESSRKLTEERNFIDTVLETQQAIVMVLDKQGRLVRVNRAVEEMRGPRVLENIGTHDWMRDFEGDVAGALRQTLEGLAAGKRWVDFEISPRDTKGQPRPLLVRNAAVRDGSGQIQYIVTTALDITEQRRAQSEARDHLEDVFGLQRLETANELASVLAHELNQPLAAINFYVAAALQELDKTAIDRAELKGLIGTISELSSKTGEVIQQSRRFFKRGEIERGAHDLNAVLRSAIGVMEVTARGQNIRIRSELEADLPEFWGVAVHIEQVVLNLLRNAAEAITEQGTSGGEITVRSQAIGHHARVTIQDTGPGLSQEQAEHVFDVMRSRKSEGLGVGLRISRNLIEAHEGEIWVEPHAPGAIFHFEVPLT